LPETPAGPRLAIIAGPNGSGKSTFFDTYLRTEFPVFVNADEIATRLPGVPESVRQLTAAEMAEKERSGLIDRGMSFAFETVFSRTDYWLDFIQRARARGFYIVLFFLSTEDPTLNAGRVATRVEEGGHSVPIDKIVSRYAGSIRTAVQAIGMVDDFWLYDNSAWNKSPLLIARVVSGRTDYVATNQPRWSEPFLPRLLGT
jgi:predicted ABC-type ATPase